MRRLAGSALAALLLGPASPAVAQLIPQPPSPARPTGWEFGATLGGGWDGNPDYVAETPQTDEGDFASFLAGIIAYNRQTPRGQFRFSVNGTTAYYPDQSNLNRTDGFTALTLSRQLSPKVTFDLGGNYTYSHTDSLPVLIEGGLAYPLSRTQSLGGNAGLSCQFTPRTSLSLNLRYNQVDFPEGPFVDTRSGNGSLSLGRRLGKRSTLSFNYGYQRTEQSSGVFDTQYATVGFSQELSRPLVLRVSGGASYYVDREIAGQGEWSFNGSVGLLGTWRRASLSALYTRSVTPAYGLGADTLSDIFSLSANVPLGRRVSLRVASTYARAHDPQDLQYLYTTNDFTFDVTWQIARRLDLLFGSRLRRREVTDSQDVWAPRGVIALAYGWAPL